MPLREDELIVVRALGIVKVIAQVARQQHNLQGGLEDGAAPALPLTG